MGYVYIPLRNGEVWASGDVPDGLEEEAALTFLSRPLFDKNPTDRFTLPSQWPKLEDFKIPDAKEVSAEPIPCVTFRHVQDFWGKRHEHK